MKQHARSQWLYSLNTLRMMALGLRQLRLPNVKDIVRNIKVHAYQSRSKPTKRGFFEKRYGARLSLAPELER